MAQVNRPSQQQSALSKTTSLAGIGASLGSIAYGNPSGPMTAVHSLNAFSSGSNLLAPGGQSEKIRTEQPQAYSAMKNQVDNRSNEGKQILASLAAGENALNQIKQTHPDVAKQFYQPLADTIMGAYNDPQFAQYRQQVRRG